MMPDDVCLKYAESGIKFKITETDNVIVIQGTAEALIFLSELFSAQSKSPDDGFEISPFGAGLCLVCRDFSTKGLYIQRIEK